MWIKIDENGIMDFRDESLYHSLLVIAKRRDISLEELVNEYMSLRLY